MNCEKCRELFPDYIGEELNPETAQEFREHVANCAGCRQERDLLGETRSALRLAWPDEAIPEPLTFDHSRTVWPARGFGAWRRQPPRVAWLGLAAAAGLVLCLGTLSFLDARIQIGEGRFSLSFGPQLPESVLRPPLSPPDRSASMEAQFRQVLDQKIGQLEQAYDEDLARLQQAVARIETQWKEQRSLDLRRVNGDLNYLEKLQEAMRQKTARNEVLISSVADHYVTRLGGRLPVLDQE